MEPTQWGKFQMLWNPSATDAHSSGVFTFGGSGPAITAHGSLDLKQEIQIQI
jgi:hypothetical protein